jgi:hypothetical protein
MALKRTLHWELIFVRQVVMEFTTMARKLSRFGLMIVVGLATGQLVMAQRGGGPVERPERPTGPAAKKANDLISKYKARIEQEVEQDRKEAERLRTELHELIDVRSSMAEAIAELRGELAEMGTYSPDLVINEPANPQRQSAQPAQQPRAQVSRDLFYGIGSALPKDPTAQQREQLRRLAPRTDLKRILERLRTDVEDVRTEVDQLAYKLLELSSGVPDTRRGFGRMGGGMGGGGDFRAFGPWFDTIGSMGGQGMR